MCWQIIEKMDLIGLDFLWKICMNVPDFSIAESAISLLLSVSYISLSAKYKRVSVVYIFNLVVSLAFVKYFSSVHHFVYFWRAGEVLASFVRWHGVGLPSRAVIPAVQHMHISLKVFRIRFTTLSVIFKQLLQNGHNSHCMHCMHRWYRCDMLTEMVMIHTQLV